MALVLADRVQEYSTTTGTGTLTLSGAYAGFQTFAAGIGNGNTCYYTITSDKNQWEVGIGTVGVGTLARTTLISSSTGSTIDFKGTLTVFVTLPAEEAVYGDDTTLVAPTGALLPIANGGTGASTAAAARTALGLGTIATQDANAVAITGGAIDGTTVGSTTAAAGSFTTLNSSGATRLGGLSGNQSLQVNNVASAVNYLQAVGAVTGSAPTLSMQGTDTNIPFAILAKGSSDVNVGGTSTTPSLKVSLVASQVNSFQVYGQATGQAPTLAAVGTDTDIGISITAKGTGSVSLSGNAQQVFAFKNLSGTDFTNLYNTTGQLNYTAAGGSTNTSFYFGAKGTGSIQLASGGGTQAVVSNTASAVNYLNLTGAATGANPTISAQGSDANINLTFLTKGTGQHFFSTGNGVQFGTASVANSVNYLQANGAPTGSAVGLNAQGVDANISLGYFGKGTGFHFFYTGGIVQASISPTASAVNRVNLTGAATGGAAAVSASGSDSNASLALFGQNAGVVALAGSTITNAAAVFVPTASVANYFQVKGSVTTGAPELSAQGSDANIGLVLKGKGTGVVALGGSTVANSGFQVKPTTSAVNSLLASGSTAGTLVYTIAQGTDTNIGLAWQSKGSGFQYFLSGGGTQFLISHVNSAVNFIGVEGAATGNAPLVYAQGSDANINLKLTPKGTGVLQFGTYTAGILAQAGYITITDAAGTSRRLLVG